MRFKIIPWMMLLTFAVMSTAYADCTSPSGKESQTQYDFTAKVLKLCDGANWLTVGSGSGISMIPNWPDALYCVRNDGTEGRLYFIGEMDSAYRYYRGADMCPGGNCASVNWFRFNATTGAYVSASYETSGNVCNNKSIATLHDENRTFNFLGGGSSGGTPAGAIMAFDLAACPTGWSEYTAARGRFLRGIDNGAGNDPDGTRTAGNTQLDAFQGHKHAWSSGGAQDAGLIDALGFNQSYNPGSNTGNWVGNPTSDGINGTPRTANETRPKNVAVLYCRKN